MKRILTLVSIIVLGYHLKNLISAWTDLSNVIAVHFTNGEPDNWGSKYLLMIIPIVGLLTWWLLGMLTKHPEKLNYVNLTEDNRDKQYRVTSKLLTIIQNLSFISLVFANQALLTYALGEYDDTFFFLSIFFLSLVVLVLFYNMVWAVLLKV